jgi:glycosyltransferase involved in cell wall biosynthesis
MLRTPRLPEDADLFVGFGPHGATIAGRISDEVPTLAYIFHPWYVLYPRGIDRVDPASKLVFGNPLLSPVLQAVDRRQVRRVGTLISISPHIAMKVKRIYGRDSQVLMPGVEARPLPPADEEHRRYIYRPREYIYMPTRIIHHKNIATAVKALYTLRRRYGWNVDLILSGNIDSKPYYAHIMRLASALGVQRHVRYLGFVDDEAMWSLYRNAVCHWFTPLEEDFGLTPLESMVMETPVIAAADGGARYTVLDGETGFLASPLDHHAYAEKTDQLLRDPELRLEMGRKGRQHVLRNFTWEHHFQRWDELIEEAVGSP